MRWVVGWSLALSLVLGAGCTEERAIAGPAPRVGEVQAALERAYDGAAPEEALRVIVNLRPAVSDAAPSPAFRRSNALMQDDVLAAYAGGFSVLHRYKHVPAIAGHLTRRALERLRRDPRVAYIQLDTPGRGQLKEAVPAIGADLVREQRGYTGDGVTVAVLDTGVATAHPDLKDSIVAQHCFTQFACPGFASESDSAEDDHGHGSNVAGIITSDGLVAPKGFAPDAKIVAVKINDRNDSGYESDWVAGLDWIYDHLDELDVKVVNMSICTNAMFTDAASCDRGEPALAAAVANLAKAGVVMFSSSGNRGSTTAMSAPACNTGVIAVGATYDSDVGAQPPGGDTYSGRWNSPAFADCRDATTAFDQVACFTNSPARLDLVAPGAPMTSDSLDGKTETYWGTSQASPVAAAVAALLLECRPDLTPQEIKDAMIETGQPVVDAKNNRTFPSLRAFEAVSRVCGDVIVGTGGTGGAATGGAGGAAGSAGGSGTTAATGGAPATASTGGVGSGAAGSAGAAGVTSASGGTGGVTAAMSSGGITGAGGTQDAGTVEGELHRAQVSCGCSAPGARSHAEAPVLLAIASVLALARRRRARR
jgi:subtilisin family serine protease